MFDFSLIGCFGQCRHHHCVNFPLKSYVEASEFAGHSSRALNSLFAYIRETQFLPAIENTFTCLVLCMCNFIVIFILLVSLYFYVSTTVRTVSATFYIKAVHTCVHVWLCTKSSLASFLTNCLQVFHHIYHFSAVRGKDELIRGWDQRCRSQQDKM